jgi:lysophospholipase L1-like esterase
MIISFLLVFLCYIFVWTTLATNQVIRQGLRSDQYSNSSSSNGISISKSGDIRRRLESIPEQKNTKRAKTILTVGDSITYGAGASDVDTKSYPALLQGELHKYIAHHLQHHHQDRPLENYTIVNLGQKGVTACKVSNNPFWNTRQFASLSTYKDVSVVILNLGANDAQNANNFNIDTFTSDYLELVSLLHKLDGDPTVFICIPTLILPRYASTKCNSTVINWIYPHLIPDIASKSNSKVIDLFTGMGGTANMDIWKVGDGETVTKFTNDGLHPNDKGYRIIADKVAQEIWKYLI